MTTTNGAICCEFSSSATIDDIIITSDSSQRLIIYDTMINRPNNYHFPEISFDDVDSYDFENKGFIEVIKSPEYVHLYFDFDSVMTSEEKQQEKENKSKNINETILNDEEQSKRLEGIIQWLETLKPIFGEYSLGGYTSNELVNEK